MTTIARVTTRVLPVRNTALSTAYQSPETQAQWRSHLFVRVETEDGNTGVAEGSPLPHFSGEDAQGMARVINGRLAPALIGRDLFATEDNQQALGRVSAGHHASKAALINALLDAQGRRLGLPVARLLGGRSGSSVAQAGAVGLVDPEAAFASLRRFHDAGIRTFKLKIGRDVRRDTRLVAAVRAEFGTDVHIRVDANGGYSRADARRFLLQSEPHDLQYVEQPLPAADLHGLAELRRLGAAPIAVDESLTGLHEAVAVIRSDAADVFIIKLIKHGGFHNARKLVALAEAAGISCVPVSPYETALGASATLQLAAVSPAFPWAAEVGAGPLQIDLDGITPLQFHAGRVSVPDGPGLGMEVPTALFANVDGDGNSVDD